MPATWITRGLRGPTTNPVKVYLPGPTWDGTVFLPAGGSPGRYIFSSDTVFLPVGGPPRTRTAERVRNSEQRAMSADNVRTGVFIYTHRAGRLLKSNVYTDSGQAVGADPVPPGPDSPKMTAIISRGLRPPPSALGGL